MLESERKELVELLDSVDCLEYLPLFEENDITPDLLPSLDREAIKEMGVNKVGDRLRIEILVKLSHLEKIKNVVPTNILNTSINVAVDSIMKMKENVDNAPSDLIINLGIITQDGKVHNLKINKSKLKHCKRKIIASVYDTVNEDEWKICYIDYKNGSTNDIESHQWNDIIFNEGNFKYRLILCRKGESPSIDAFNISNKINREKGMSKHDIKPFMGGRPPSQLISTNLREYFPDLNHNELEDIKRKSIRLSMYSSEMIDDMSNKRFTLSSNGNRDSLYSRLSDISKLSNRMSMLSIASYGVGMPLKVDHHYQPQIEEEKTVDDWGTIVDDKRPDSFIELLDESDGDYDDDDDDDVYQDAEEDEMLSVISKEVANGPSVWHRGPKIGQGSFGNVYLGLNGLTGELMAIKQVDIPQNESENSKKMMVNALKQEISLLKDLSHENIVRYLGSNTDNTNMYIFLEYIPGGSVSSMLKLYGPFEEELIRNFTRQVLIGLVYLHSKGIIHRDIKGGNILVDNTGTVKIGDFGISKKITPQDEENGNETTNKRSSLQGSVFWMAPEVVKQVAYTEKADIWSVGCLIVEMYTGKHPYPNLSQMQAIFQIGTGRAQPGIPEKALNNETAVEFFRHVFEADYVQRWQAVDLLKLKWMAL